MEERRRAATATERKPFSLLARHALEKFIAESRTANAHWGSKPNLGWVRWQLQDGRYVYMAVRRHLDWVTGEVGTSNDPKELESLELKAVPDPSPRAAYRVRLGHLLHDEDKWWPAGKSERELTERIEWLVLQMRVKIERFFETGRR